MRELQKKCMRGSIAAWRCSSVQDFHMLISASELVNLPLYSVGHSNGALLQLLVGCYLAEKIPKANVVVSFNNRPASEAVPYFEQVILLLRIAKRSYRACY
ncbi:alpha/beta-Hydrolases protein [Dioscorea alata]|uniref:Alpha/beta-Hydrolases protein n=1 Tax=Dioscorea alata TaxID=55571 RepID=A0ACB7VC12_DIOAL|nr:alpha/beta-Hydrolases protein [Dioscorea alata]